MTGVSPNDSMTAKPHDRERFALCDCVIDKPKGMGYKAYLIIVPQLPGDWQFVFLGYGVAAKSNRGR
jgi:hypothetical protein